MIEFFVLALYKDKKVALSESIVFGFLFDRGVS